ncbi:MAG: LD-carboxypeptidase [Flavobacteriales bacterium]|nr:LD-carboxypeptidase [Flavobacteriales bacterium]
MLIPPPLRTGDLVAIVPTARAIRHEELQDAVTFLEAHGLRVALGEGVGRKDFQQAGTAMERRSDLQRMIDDPEVKAIWCARGGYGTVHLLGSLDLGPLQRDPKWVIGFSDVTALHNLLHREGVASLHAQMPFMIGRKSEATRISLLNALFHEEHPIETKSLAGYRSGEARAPLVGGNLSVLYSLRGTAYDMDPAGKILFLEDLDELNYHMDRMLQNLALGGWFRQLAGLIVGGMSDMRDKDERDPFGRSPEAVIRELVQGTNYPVCFGFPAGHEDDNRALVLGAVNSLNVENGDVSLRLGPDQFRSNLL